MSSIDIVVPCYRYGRYLRECVQSVLSQGIAELRVLVIDDESPDETAQVGLALARDDSRVTYRRHAANRGHISTYNEGIEWTDADYMLLLSADDYLLPGALKRAMDLMDAQPQVGLCIGEAVVLRTDGSKRPMHIDVETGGRSSVVIGGADFIRLCMRAGANNVVPTPTAVVKTRLLKLLGGYRADLPHSGDLEMWLRLAAHSSIGIIKAEQAVYRRHAANMSLAYTTDGCLIDLQQRKAALDAFLETAREVLPGAERLHRSLLDRLALETVGQASCAFNSNLMDVARRLCDFAIVVDPRVRRSRSWNLLACKKLIGFRASRALLPAIASLRAATTRLRS
jgi:glycosyltransferase involved in cell wall biosynthesis